MKRALLLTIRLYQRLLSPLLLPACRYLPTCSEYAHQAVELHGSAEGAMLAAWRLLRCHPFSRGGYDPVPHNNCDPVLPTNSEGHGGTCPERSRGSRAVDPHSHIRALAPEAKEKAHVAHAPSRVRSSCEASLTHTSHAYAQETSHTHPGGMQ